MLPHVNVFLVEPACYLLTNNGKITVLYKNMPEQLVQRFNGVLFGTD